MLSEAEVIAIERALRVGGFTMREKPFDWRLRNSYAGIKLHSPNDFSEKT